MPIKQFGMSSFGIFWTVILRNSSILLAVQLCPKNKGVKLLFLSIAMQFGHNKSEPPLRYGAPKSQLKTLQHSSSTEDIKVVPHIWQWSLYWARKKIFVSFWLYLSSINVFSLFISATTYLFLSFTTDGDTLFSARLCSFEYESMEAAMFMLFRPPELTAPNFFIIAINSSQIFGSSHKYHSLIKKVFGSRRLKNFSPLFSKGSSMHTSQAFWKEPFWHNTKRRFLKTFNALALSAL